MFQAPEINFDMSLCIFACCSTFNTDGQPDAPHARVTNNSEISVELWGILICFYRSLDPEKILSVSPVKSFASD